MTKQMQEKLRKDAELAVVPSKEQLQKNLKQTLRKIDARLKELGFNTIDDPFQTNGTFKYNENDSNVINILTHLDLVYLGKALAMCKRVKIEYEDTMTELNINKYPILLWLGQDMDEWIHDLTNRIKMVANHNIISTLTQKKNELQQFLSQDEKLFNILSTTAELM